MSKQCFEKGQLILSRIKTDGNTYMWNIHQYMGEDNEKIFVLGGFLLKEHNQFAPYEANEALLGTYGDAPFIWQPRIGELVAVSDDKEVWFAQVFMGKVRGREEGAYESSDTHDSSQPAYWQYCEPLHEHFNVPEKE